MKKLSLLFVFVVLAVAIFAITAFAAQPNIANQAEVTTSTNCWVVKDNLGALTDGNREIGTGSSHSEAKYSINFKYLKNMQFEKIIVVVNGKGTTDSTYAVGTWTEVTNNNYPIKITMTNIYGDVVYEQSYETGDTIEIVIVPTDYVSQITLDITSNWNNQLAVWEVEAYGCVAHDCDFQLTSTTTAPTCGVAGVGIYTCSICSETKEDIIPATGEHSWDEGVVTTQPTDSSSGVKTYTCSVCSHTKDEILAATGHNWDSGTVVAPNCTEQGYTLFTCTDEGCEATYKDFYVNELNHSYDDGVETKHATLSAEGEILYSCTRDNCDHSYTESTPRATITDSLLVIGLDKIISATEEVNGTKGDKSDYTHLFDGNNQNASWSQSNPGGWYLPSGSSMTLVFDEEYYIVSFNFYIWSNYGRVRMEFMDASGAVVATHQSDVTDTGNNIHAIGECVDKAVKSVKISILSAKGDTGNCFDFQEFIITAHKHLAEGENAKYDEVIGCVDNGSYKKFCYVCEKEVLVETKPSGIHDLSTDITFPKGFDMNGSVSSTCSRCDFSEKQRLKPIFYSYGYSVREDGGAITHRIEIDLEALAAYESYAKAPLVFGTVAAATPNFEGAPIEVVDGTVVGTSSRVSVKTLSGLGYVSIENRIANIPEFAYDTEVVLCPFIYDGKSISYINANKDSGAEFETVTYNNLLQN